MDIIVKLGAVRDIRELEMSIGQHWVGQTAGMIDHKTFVVPYRYTDSGWFDYQPMSPVYPAALWNITGSQQDWDRIEHLRISSNYEWDPVVPFRGKEDFGHEQPWLRFIAGHNPTYPESMLQASIGIVTRRLDMIRADNDDLSQVNIHHWQQLNPVTTEALVQLTTGAPQIIYNGGLLFCRVRYFDPIRKRPGLPSDIAALVESIADENTVVHLVNLNLLESREILIQAGAFGEHRFASVTYAERTSDYPGQLSRYAPPQLQTSLHQVVINDKLLKVIMPPGTEIVLDFMMERFVNEPSYRLPW